MMDIRIYSLIHKELTGELTNSEAQELTQLKHSTGYRNAAHDISLIWNASKEYFPTHNWDTPAAKKDFFNRLRNMPTDAAGDVNMNKYLGIGLLIILFVLMGYFLSQKISSTQAIIEPVIDKIDYAVLQDDSKIWIQEGSSIVEKSFTNDKRVVQLKGSAIFDVSKDPKRPFTVDMGHGVHAQVLGTAFKATSAHAQHRATISVREGTIRLFVEGDRQLERIIKSGERAAIDLKSKKITVSNQIQPIVLSEGGAKLKLVNLPLSEVFELAGKYYGVTFEVSEAELQCSYTNTSVNDIHLQDLLDGIQMSYGDIVIATGDRSTYTVKGRCQ